MILDEYWVPNFDSNLIEWVHVVVHQTYTERTFRFSKRYQELLTVTRWPY